MQSMGLTISNLFHIMQHHSEKTIFCSATISLQLSANSVKESFYFCFGGVGGGGGVEWGRLNPVVLSVAVQEV